jgi:hypothetical protein
MITRTKTTWLKEDNEITLFSKMDALASAAVAAAKASESDTEDEDVAAALIVSTKYELDEDLLTLWDEGQLIQVKNSCCAGSECLMKYGVALSTKCRCSAWSGLFVRAKNRGPGFFLLCVV